MEKQELIQLLEALLFASGKPVSLQTLCEVTSKEKEEVEEAMQELKQNLIARNSGIQLLEVKESYQLATLEKFYSYICTMLDNRPKPNLSQAAFEVLSIVAYNQNVTRAELEKIRGVSSDSALNKLLEYNLIEEAGKMDAPGRPMMYRTTDEFLKMFGYKTIQDLPELPKLKEETDEQLRIETKGSAGEMVEEIIEEGEEKEKDKSEEE